MRDVYKRNIESLRFISIVIANECCEVFSEHMLFSDVCPTANQPSTGHLRESITLFMDFTSRYYHFQVVKNIKSF